LSAPESFTGERFLPGVVGEIAYEHCHRYAFARRFVAGRRVLDAACGEGYGAALLASVAQTTVGIDIDASVVAEARVRYRAHGNLLFGAASVTRLPLPDASVDAVVSFETIEHLPSVEQPQMLAEFARVLAPGGILILSSPNRPEYSDARHYANPFHLAELDRDELTQRLMPRFAASAWFAQRRYLGSAIWSEAPGERFEALSGSVTEIRVAQPPPALYFIVIAAREADALPPQVPALSLYADGDDAEWTRIDHEAREVLRLDGLLRTRDAELREQVRYTDELKAMIAARDGAIAERVRAEAALRMDFDAALGNERAAHAAECQRLMRAIDAQERIVAYRESVRWWFVLPLLRARRLWNRIRPV
jgi:ubiquinone/menaquinone biosynthesis C-methylase UbiE